jgi:hypothetical protein
MLTHLFGMLRGALSTRLILVHNVLRDLGELIDTTRSQKCFVQQSGYFYPANETPGCTKQVLNKHSLILLLRFIYAFCAITANWPFKRMIKFVSLIPSKISQRMHYVVALEGPRSDIII